MLKFENITPGPWEWANRVEVTEAWLRQKIRQHREAQRRWEKAHPTQRRLLNREHRLKKKYGISSSRYNTLLTQQNDCCALCLVPFKSDETRCVEHDHLTGKVRGIVHSNCNSLLGMAEDSVLKLNLAIQYLERSAKCLTS